MLAFLLLGASGRAQEQGGQASESHEEHFHRNELALVLASTYEAEERENLFTVGGEYERRFALRMGVSGTFEHFSRRGHGREETETSDRTKDTKT